MLGKSIMQSAIMLNIIVKYRQQWEGEMKKGEKEGKGGKHYTYKTVKRKIAI